MSEQVFKLQDDKFILVEAYGVDLEEYKTGVNHQHRNQQRNRLATAVGGKSTQTTQPASQNTQQTSALALRQPSTLATRTGQPAAQGTQQSNALALRQPSTLAAKTSQPATPAQSSTGTALATTQPDTSAAIKQAGSGTSNNALATTQAPDDEEPVDDFSGQTINVKPATADNKYAVGTIGHELVTKKAKHPEKIINNLQSWASRNGIALDRRILGA